MTGDDVIREAEARSAALRTYAAAHDRLAELEQMHMLAGNHAEATGARVIARQVLAAWHKELRDPVPEGLPA